MEIFAKRSDYGNVLPLLLMLLVFLYLTAYILPTNIHGDGRIHTLVAREIAQTGHLPRFFPYHIMSIDEGGRTMLPISYPLTSHTLMALFYMAGGEDALKFFSPLLGALIAAFIFFLLRPISSYGAFAAALLAIILNAQRLFMVPLLEQLLLFGMVASLYFYYMFLRRQKSRYLILAGLFLGLVLATKLQGLVFFAVILMHGTGAAIYMGLREGNIRFLKRFALVVAIAVVVSAGPLAGQVERNGTVMPVPARPGILSLGAKFLVDQQAQERLQQKIGYDIRYRSLTEAARVYLISPVYYARSLEIIRRHSNSAALSLSLMLPLLMLGLVHIFRRDRMLLSLLLLVFLAEILFAYLTHTWPFQYHNIGLATLGIFLIFGLFGVKGVTGYPALNKLVLLIAIPVFVIATASGYANYIHEPLWKNSGRFDDYRLQAYREMGDFVRSKTPRDAVFLAGGGAGTGFAYYSKRDVTWIRDGGGAEVPTIFSTQNQDEALYWLKNYQIDYIFIDTRQTENPGVNDSIPRRGLLDYIDSSPHFKKVRSVYQGDEILKLYEVIY
jgi:hypothetical protein